MRSVAASILLVLDGAAARHLSQFSELTHSELVSRIAAGDMTLIIRQDRINRNTQIEGVVTNILGNRRRRPDPLRNDHEHPSHLVWRRRHIVQGADGCFQGPPTGHRAHPSDTEQARDLLRADPSSRRKRHAAPPSG